MFSINSKTERKQALFAQEAIFVGMFLAIAKWSHTCSPPGKMAGVLSQAGDESDQHLGAAFRIKNIPVSNSHLFKTETHISSSQF